MASDIAIETKGLTKRYDTLTALDGLSLSVNEGEVYGILGPNGAGKSTLIRITCGLLNPSGGTVLVRGIDVRERPEAVKALIGYLPEETSLYEHMTVLEYLTFFADLYGLGREEGGKRAHKLVERLDLGDKRTDRIDTLSKGLKRRVAIARALVHDPSILILDEPTSGLDPVASLEIRELIASLAEEEGKTVLLSTHLVWMAERLCHRIGILSKGNLLLSGTTDEVCGRLDARQTSVEVVVECPPGKKMPSDPHAKVERKGKVAVLTFPGVELAAKALDELRRSYPVVSITTAQRSLEDVFLERFSRSEEGRE